MQYGLGSTPTTAARTGRSACSSMVRQTFRGHDLRMLTPVIVVCIDGPLVFVDTSAYVGSDRVVVGIMTTRSCVVIVLWSLSVGRPFVVDLLWTVLFCGHACLGTVAKKYFKKYFLDLVLIVILAY